MNDDFGPMFSKLNSTLDRVGEKLVKVGDLAIQQEKRIAILREALNKILKISNGDIETVSDRYAINLAGSIADDALNNENKVP